MKFIPKNYICNVCGNEQYTNEYCYQCEKETSFSKIKLDPLYPVGVVPKNIWLQERKQNLRQAIIRYLDADLTPPNEWYEELEDLDRSTYS